MGNNLNRICTYDISCHNVASALFDTFQVSKTKLECYDTEQDIKKLPPPYIFGEGIRFRKKKNSTCLDYKARLVAWGRVVMVVREITVQYYLDTAVRARLYSGPCLSPTLRTKSNTPCRTGKFMVKTFFALFLSWWSDTRTNQTWHWRNGEKR